MIQKGFSLVELLVVVALIGILIAVAIPSYNDYIIRGKLVEGLHLAAPAKIAVADYVINNHKLPSNQESTGYRSPSPTSNVKSITIGDKGIITITYTPSAGDGTIVVVPTIEPNGYITWDCTGGTERPRYRPRSCRIED